MLIPWLVGTALLHSLMIQERREALRTWDLCLTVLTFLLCVFATFVTRSGIIQSVHAFGRSPVGCFFVASILLCLLALVSLLRIPRRGLGGAWELSSLVSREAALLFISLLLQGAAVVAMARTWFTQASC